MISGVIPLTRKKNRQLADDIIDGLMVKRAIHSLQATTNYYH